MNKSPKNQASVQTIKDLVAWMSLCHIFLAQRAS